MLRSFQNHAGGLCSTVVIALSLLNSTPLPAADETQVKPDAFLSRYCLGCHGSNEQKGDRRFDNLPTTVGVDVAIGERWQEVLHQLQLGEMPPSDEQQPTDDERRAMVAWIEAQVTQAQTIAQDRGGQVVHRRLNRAEYVNTIKDIFGFDGDFDPTTSFPGDEELEGFRNIGSALRTSRHHLEQYLTAADEVLEQAYDLADVDGTPKVQEWKDSADDRRGLNDAFGLGVISEEKANGPAYIHLSHGLRNQQLIFDSKLFLSNLGDTGVPHSGWYDVEVEATAANRHHPYGKDLMLGGMSAYYKDLKAYYDESQPMQLGIGRQGEGMKGNGWRLIPPNIVHATELPDDRCTTVRAPVWLDRGTVPYLAWIDGPPKGTRSQFISTKLYKYDSSVPKIEKHIWENLALRAERDKLYQHLYQGPEIRVRYWQVTGPMRDDKPHRSWSLLFENIKPDEANRRCPTASRISATLQSSLSSRGGQRRHRPLCERREGSSRWQNTLCRRCTTRLQSHALLVRVLVSDRATNRREGHHADAVGHSILLLPHRRSTG